MCYISGISQVDLQIVFRAALAPATETATVIAITRHGGLVNVHHSARFILSVMQIILVRNVLHEFNYARRTRQMLLGGLYITDRLCNTVASTRGESPLLRFRPVKSAKCYNDSNLETVRALWAIIIHKTGIIVFSLPKQKL